MSEPNRDTNRLVAAFDERAATYSAHRWHVKYAQRLVEQTGLRPGNVVLDAATGTGMAAVAAARVVGPTGAVVGVDISGGMLDKARATPEAAELSQLTFLEADATRLQNIGANSFDAVICSAGLLYMPADRALREWHRVIKVGGIVGFSTMRRGSPPAAKVFRACGREFGLNLRDPSAPLGSERKCREHLSNAGFRVREVIADRVEFTNEDLLLAWEANLRTAGHEDALRLPDFQLQQLKAQFEAALNLLIAQGNELRYADVLYAFGLR